MQKRHTPSVLHGKATLVHLVLFRRSPRQQVDISRLVPLHLERTRLECPLLADQDVEVVIRSMQSTVSLGTEGRTKYNEIFGDGRVNDVHGSHGTASIVEHPFRGISVQRNLIGRLRKGRGKVGNNVLDHALRVVGRCGNGISCEFMQERRV